MRRNVKVLKPTAQTVLRAILGTARQPMSKMFGRRPASTAMRTAGSMASFGFAAQDIWGASRSRP
jgi:hypothetical protein